MADVLTLTLLDPQNKTPQKQWKFEDQSVIEIGRASDNQVVIVDPLVSRYHLQLRKLSENPLKWMLVNKGTNGTFVNGVLTSQAVVTEGILIELAKGGPLLQLNWQFIRPVSIPNTSGCTHAGNPPNNLFCIHCGLPIHIERSIRNYHVLRTLGQGGMGTTTLAWNAESSLPQTLGQIRIPALVVLKEMNADMAQIAKAQELFEREARTLKGLNHEGIPQFYDFFVEEGKKYLAMEMVHGQDLEKIVQYRGPVTPQQAINWMIQTCEVLGYLHVQDPPIIHRDIKPANLLLRNLDQRIVVLDFGAVKEIGTPPGTRIGAEGYSAPEQDRGQPLTLSDLYAIGSTLIFLLTGESPLNFYGKRDDSYGFSLESVPTITPELRTVIERVTEYRPRDRYQDAQHLCQALRECLN
ncbi:protein kinase [Lyngbya sp. PCC 8106]|uniref:protein kinase domain-containing protein n=1 Tax=Lyngbya sp. (strain PCC 8106) TaxID=313612 RepID=UPI0000EAAB1B|nr:protein kinase [Lyngbya sp. PCC 8106]EAW33637.1 Serine/Threonine protein kinase with FHA domain modulation [Lyngbya sp. PCC 8106]